jgi:hypothetical protein
MAAAIFDVYNFSKKLDLRSLYSSFRSVTVICLRTGRVIILYKIMLAHLLQAAMFSIRKPIGDINYTAALVNKTIIFFFLFTFL